MTNSSPSDAPGRVNHSNSSQRSNKVRRVMKELPTSVARTLDQSSSISSMEFSPVHSTILIVGNVVGDVIMWEVDSGNMILQQHFEIWDSESVSAELLSALEEALVSVSCLKWNQEGTLLGVAYSKHILQLFACTASNNLTRHKEINAHIGSVNDFIFAENLLITCGSDRKIKVWNLAANFLLNCTIEDCEEPIYSLCPFVSDDIPFLILHSLSGDINVCSYDGPYARSAHIYRSWQCTTKSYNAYGKRIFTSGKDERGEPYIVEWCLKDALRIVRKSFRGFQACSGFLHFDVSNNGILAAGIDHQIKFWDSDDGRPLDSYNADNNLPDAPLVKFNKDGNFLAVSANNNEIKILVATDGVKCNTLLPME